MAAKKKEIDWDEGIIDLMPEKDQIRIFKKLAKAIREDKTTPEGRRRLAASFGGKPSDYKPVTTSQKINAPDEKK